MFGFPCIESGPTGLSAHNGDVAKSIRKFTMLENITKYLPSGSISHIRNPRNFLVHEVCPRDEILEINVLY